jgi:hypothetical protein
VHQGLGRGGILPGQWPEGGLALQRIAHCRPGKHLTRKQARRADGFLRPERAGELLVLAQPVLHGEDTLFPQVTQPC